MQKAVFCIFAFAEDTDLAANVVSLTEHGVTRSVTVLIVKRPNSFNSYNWEELSER
jgi:hypothetical protein